MAQVLAQQRATAWFSYAGRTRVPRPQPITTRIGGFGGVQGLTAWLHKHRISHVIDATHPFASQMSVNAISACAIAGVALCSFERAPWRAHIDDQWQHVPDINTAVDTLPKDATRVFLAIGKQHIDTFYRQAQHHYLLRLVDPPGPLLPAQSITAVIDRGPFSLADDLVLLQQHAIEMVVAKNSGGNGARAKLDAARELRLPVIIIERPKMPPRTIQRSVDDVLQWLFHTTLRGV